MKTDSTTKNIRISADALNSVLQVSKESRRNLTGATDYLIERGYKVYITESQILESIMHEQALNEQIVNKNNLN
ncbi:MAG: hypothetical protein NT007_00920 [Candidatus Kapabacteria bacterium]|nr:hypothetical protein [Candidatus Kapabacteria bacterium]